jgi:hypothetical protein
MKRPKKAGAPKAVSYVLIPEKSEIGTPMYERLYGLDRRAPRGPESDQRPDRARLGDELEG